MPKTGQKWLKIIKNCKKKGLILENLFNFHCIKPICF